MAFKLCGRTHNKDRAKEMFAAWDLNHDGVVSLEEFETMLKKLVPTFSKEELDLVFKEADKNDHGVINMEEFLEWVYKHEDPADELSTAIHKAEEKVHNANLGIVPAHHAHKKKEHADDKDHHGDTHVHLAVEAAVGKLGPPESHSNAGSRRPSHGNIHQDHHGTKEEHDKDHHHGTKEHDHLKAKHDHHEAHVKEHGAVFAAGAIGGLTHHGDHDHHKHQILHEEDLTTVDQLWVIINGLGSHMSINDFSLVIADAFEMGILKCFPKSNDAHMVVLTPARAITLIREIAKDEKKSTKDLCTAASGIEEGVQMWEVLPNEKLGESGIEIHLRIFEKYIQVLAEILRVDEQVVVSFLVWSVKQYFELSDSQSTKIGEVVKAARPREHKDGDVRLDSSDMEVLMRSCDIISATAEGHMTSDTLHSAFVKFLKHSEELMKARQDNRPGKNISHHDHFSAYRHEIRGGVSLVGRTELSLFLFELWKDPSHHLLKRFHNPYLLSAALAGCEDKKEEEKKE